MSEETMIIEENNFKNENRLMLACYICDKNGNELEPDEYKEKGNTLKIITEEYTREIAVGDKRYHGTNVDKYLYHNPEEYYGEHISSDILYKESDEEIEADMQRFQGSGTSIMFNQELVDKLNEVNFNNKINDHENPSTIRMSEYKHTTEESDVDESGNTTTVTVIDDSCPIRHTHLHVVDRYCSHSHINYDENVEVETVDNMRKIGEVSEIYARKTPSIRIDADSSGLDSALLRLTEDERISTYNIEKIVIDKHISIELKRYNSSKYVISGDTYKLLFNRFKKIEIRNPLIKVIFPEGELKVDTLAISDCTILVNNSIIKVDSSLDINNCTFRINKPDGSVKHLVFNVKNDINIVSLNIKEKCKLSFITDDMGNNMTMSGINYDIPSDEYTNLKGSPLNIVGFTKLNLDDIVRSDNTNMPENSLVNIINCITVDILGISAGSNKYTSNLINVKGYDELNIIGIEDYSESPGTLLNVSETGKESILNISDIQCNVNKLITSIKSDTLNMTISDSNISVNKLWSLINTNINEFNVNNSSLTVNEETHLKLIDSDFDETQLHIDNLFIDVNNKISFTNSNIYSKNLTFNVDESSKFVSTDSNFDISDTIKIEGADKSKIEFIKSTIDGGKFISNNVNSFTNLYSYISIKEYIIENSSIFNSTDTKLRINKLNYFKMLNIDDLKRSSFIIEDGNLLTIESVNCKGSITYTVNNDCKLKRNSSNSIIVEEYIGDKKFSINLNSEGCKSSAFIVDKSKLLAHPLCKDFKLLKPIDPVTFKEPSAIRGVYEYIFYGLK